MAPESSLSGDDSGYWPQRRQRDPALSLRDRTRRAESPALSHDDYTVAWICALSLELTASRAMFDVIHENLVAQRGDDNAYVLGRIAHHNVVMVALPGAYGKVNAATVSTNLKRTFPNIATTLMVGIGGGAPGEANMRLGDVVVATRVIEYDLGKAIGDGQFESTVGPKRPSQLLLSAVTALRSKHGQSQSSTRMLALLRGRLADHARPTEPDRLFRAVYIHPTEAANCDDCDSTFLQPRSQRLSAEPWIHYGGIASGDSVNKDAQKRDAISRRLNTVCFEMEAAGMMDNLQCLPIRGICDYSDSHKNKRWQSYAAATAAAYARELLETIHLPRFTHRPSTDTYMDPNSPTGRLSAAPARGKEHLISLLDFPQMGSRRSAIRPPQKKTCSWLLDHPKYLDWLDPDKQECHNGFLWIRGKAGAGKSTLMKFLYSEARKVNDDSSVISYFFNARGEYLERSTIGMYRSLLKHLLFHMSTTEWHQIKYDTDLRSVFESQGQGCPGFNELKQMVRGAVLAREQRPLIFFIDALDECDEDDVRDMMCFFEDLAEDATDEGIELHVCFSSRPYPYVSIRTGLLMTLEEEAGHTADLVQYVNKRLRIQHQYRAEFESHILHKASGIFMWVVLVVDILNKESDRGGLSLRRRLSEIPPGLSQLFKDILTRDDESPQELRRCVLWILCARRPLEPDEFRHAMWAAGLEDGRVDNEIPDSKNPESSNALVISSSKGLAEVTRSGRPIVQFIHESVRDFLVRDRGLQELWPDLGFEWEGLGHESLRKYCELYILAVLRSERSKPSQNMPDGNNVSIADLAAPRGDTSHAFSTYTTSNILFHSNIALLYLPQTAFLARFFGFDDEADIDYSMAPSYSHRTTALTGGGSILEVFASRGLENLVQMAVQTMRAGMTHAPMSEQHRNAFFAALRNQFQPDSSRNAIAPLLGLTSLIDEGKNIETAFNAETIRGRTPLSWASQEGHLTLARVLIRNGESVSENDSQGFTPLRRASRESQVSIIQLLIQSGLSKRDIALDIQEELGDQYWGGVRMLLNLYDESDEMSEGPATIESPWLLRIVSHTPRDIVDRLIRHTANINNGGPRVLSLLRLAIVDGRLERLTFFLDRGVDVNTRNSCHETLLMTAVKQNQAAVVRLLIERGADLRITEPSGMTARDLAVFLGRQHLIRIFDKANACDEETESSVK